MDYDDNGNLTNKTESAGTTQLSYDPMDQLVQATKTWEQPQTYQYDDQGRRISKSVGGKVTNYVYNGQDIIAEYTGTWNNAAASYTHGSGTDQPLIRTTGGATPVSQYYHQDGLGSVTAVTDQNGTTVGTARSDAWGNKLSGNGGLPQYGYTGREPDETGLVFYRGRYYDPTIGRFIQRDPIGMAGGPNLYAYVGNNPINLVDPDGTLASPWHFGITLGAALNSGYGLLDSLSLAWKATAVDIGTQGPTPADTVIHAMAGTFPNQVQPQTPQQAIMAAKDFIAYNSQPDNFTNLATAAHTVQDLKTPDHAGQKWPPDGDSFLEKAGNYFAHLVGDLFPSFDTISQAYKATKQVFADATNGPMNVTEPFDINKPEYGYQAPTQPSPSNLGILQNGAPEAPYAGSSAVGFNPRGGK